MSNYDRLEKLMNDQIEVKEGWWGLKPNQANKQKPSQTEELQASIAELLQSNKELKESNENLAAEVWDLKSNMDFLIKSLFGK